MPNMPINLEQPTDEHGCLVYPVVFWRGRLSAFIPLPSGDGPHRFGGSLPASADIPAGAILHCLLTITPHQCDALDGLDLPSLPLIFPFRHNGGRIQYHCNNGKTTVDKIDPVAPCDDWPYDGYPDELPAMAVGSSLALSVEPTDFDQMLPQRLPGNSDDKIIFAVPPREDYGVSLWGQIGDAEMVLCVFVYDPATSVVIAENQCS